MTCTHDEPEMDKLSPEFAARLDRLAPQQSVRAIVMLDTEGVRSVSSQRQTRSERQAAIEAMRHAAEEALREIDEILERAGGKRITAQPDVLGSVSVDVPAAGLRRLATSAYVKAILEDQEISLLPAPEPPST